MCHEGSVDICKCHECGEQFPAFVFSADTDMVTWGCVSLIGLDKTILLTEQSPVETREQLKLRAGPNFKFTTVRYLESEVPAGLSFQEFRKIYKAPTAIYSCIYCGADSQVIREETKEQFLEHGKIMLLNPSQHDIRK